MNQTRELALTMLTEILGQGTYSHLLIRQTLDKYDYLDERDKAFAKRITEGTLERLTEMDYIIAQFSKVPVSKMKPLIRNLLRMSVYQIKYMDGVPDRAVCDEAVKLAGKRGFRGLQGFVNGILRNIARQKGEIVYPDPQKQEREYLSVKYSMPLWLVDFWREHYGAEKTYIILEGLLKEHPVTLRLSERCSEQEQQQWMEDCKAQGARISPHPYLSYAYRVEESAGIRRLPGFTEGLFAVQDVSSMLVTEISGVGGDEEKSAGYEEGQAAVSERESKKQGAQKLLVLDVCAAPGGKAVHMAQRLGDRGEVIARDINGQKALLIQENASRMQTENLKVQTWDALVFDETFREAADIVLADLPCSGLGVIGKKRDIKYRVTREEIETLAELQRQMLSVIWQYVKPGGLLIYSTCTITPQENEEQVRWFTGQYPFVPESLVPYLPKELQGLLQAQTGMLQLFPGEQESDGFFLARLRRQEESKET